MFLSAIHRLDEKTRERYKEEMKNLHSSTISYCEYKSRTDAIRDHFVLMTEVILQMKYCEYTQERINNILNQI